MERHSIRRPICRPAPSAPACRALAVATAVVVAAGCSMLPPGAVSPAPAANNPPLPSALNNPARKPCSPEWFAYVEKHYSALGEEQPHDPDLGSDAWLDAFERHRHLPSTSGLPRAARCEHLARELDYRY